MTEQQAQEIIELLKDIKKIVSDIDKGMPSTTYDLGDVCSGLDDVKKAIEKLDK